MEESWIFDIYVFVKMLVAGLGVVVLILFLKRLVIKLLKGRWGDGGALAFLVCVILASLIFSVISQVIE